MSKIEEQQGQFSNVDLDSKETPEERHSSDEEESEDEVQDTKLPAFGISVAALNAITSIGKFRNFYEVRFAKILICTLLTIEEFE